MILKERKSKTSAGVMKKYLHGRHKKHHRGTEGSEKKHHTKNENGEEKSGCSLDLGLGDLLEAAAVKGEHSHVVVLVQEGQTHVDRVAEAG